MKGKLEQYFDGFFDTIERNELTAELATATRMMTEFGLYVDSYASANPHRLHHVYEWGMVGQQQGRLFNLTAVPAGNSVIITYEFLPSVVPNENGVVFTDKATVMESGETVTFETNKPVPINDGETFRVGQFTFVPGGVDTNGAFQETFMLYFASRKIEATIRSIKMKPSALTRSGGERDAKRIYDSIIG